MLHAAITVGINKIQENVQVSDLTETALSIIVSIASFQLAGNPDRHLVKR
jgi:hypothetical protein